MLNRTDLAARRYYVKDPTDGGRHRLSAVYALWWTRT